MKKILLAVDDSAYSEAAIDALLAQVRPASVEVLVLNVVEWPFPGPPYLSFGVGPSAIQGVLALREKALAAAAAYVSRVVTRLKAEGFTATGTVREHDARSAIVNVATTWNADLIVMGSHGRRGFERYALGSVAESVLRHATCSVEIVRSPPKGATAVKTDRRVSAGDHPPTIESRPGA